MRRRRKVLLWTLGVLLLLGAGLGWRIHTWGRPLPAVYREVSPKTYVRRDATDHYVAEDTTGNGTVDRVRVEGSHPRSFDAPRADDPEARWLIVCLDGVPFKEFNALWAEGHFREFYRPVPVISPFPSASGVALSALFHASPVAGYEDGYFDRGRNELSGGALKTSTLTDMPYVQLLDYDMPGWGRGLAYVLPEKTFHADVSRLRQRFLESREKVFLAHIASTDSVYHVVPQAEARRLLLEVEAVLRELYLDAGGKLRITIFSDHGNSLVQNRSVPLEAHLSAHGWQRTKKLGGPREVVVPAYGLMGFFAVYCEPGQRASLAHDLASLEGADFVAYAEGDRVLVENAQGHARLEWKPDGSAYRYQPESADPLALGSIVLGLKQLKKLDAEGWGSDADWLAATSNHRYPDALHRLRDWATNHVRNRADVIVNLKPGYHQGSATFDRVVTMLSTHGSLDASQSLGFATSTDGPLPGPVRAEELLPQKAK